MKQSIQIMKHFSTITKQLSTYQYKAISCSDFKRAVVAVILLPQADTGAELLFIKRSEHPADPWSGHVAFPGGRVDPEDNGIKDAVFREVQEEIDLDLQQRGTYLGRLNDVRAMARGKRLPMVISPFVFSITQKPDVTLSDEVVETLWVPLTFFYQKNAESIFPYKLKGINIPLPCYRYEGRVIWGLTYKMLQNFLHIIGA
ncbi:NUDIX hydrolase [candidate division CSSED10-310 bacterium]|uniref:NUDIX hydrolase n=1 Tax=candidate division CSSED10-310 bacterium TaxID=2855610 RepID=A0ABV6YYJ9_UNCC1